MSKFIQEVTKVIGTERERLPLLINDIQDPRAKEFYKSKLQGEEVPEFSMECLRCILEEEQAASNIQDFQLVLERTDSDIDEYNVYYRETCTLKYIKLTLCVRNNEQ